MSTSLFTAASCPFAALPDAVFCAILEWLHWSELASLDRALLAREPRNRYLDALMLMKVQVTRDWFWDETLRKGMLNWLVRRHVWVTSWDNRTVDDEGIAAIASGNLPNLQSLYIHNYSKITDAGVIALANGNLPNLQSLDISGYGSKITGGYILSVALCAACRTVIHVKNKIK